MEVQKDSSVQIEVTPADVTVQVGGQRQLVAVVRDSSGAEISGATVNWSSASTKIVAVSATGVITAIAAGRTTVKVSYGDAQHDVPVTVGSAPSTPPVTPPPVASSGEFVVYPNDSVAFILGPAIKFNSSANPWPWFDENAHASGLKFGDAYPAQTISPTGVQLVATDAAWMGNYYDIAMTLYGLHARGGGDAHLQNARKIADAYYDFIVYQTQKYGTTAPRHFSFGGLILRALDGRPEMWPFLTDQTRKAYNTWIGLRLDYPGFYIGIRESSFALMHVSWLAKVHPDAAVRAEMRGYADAAVQRYFLRLERDGVTGPNGGSATGFWWTDGLVEDGKQLFAQPFMVGLLLEALTYYHQLSQDPDVAATIARTVERLHGYYRANEPVVEKPGVYWRNHPYFVYPDGTWNSATSLPGGWDTNTIREARQANSDILHAYGYAYRVTGDTKFREWGDEVFAATFGKGQGPLTDPYNNLSDYNAKSYGQAYRSAGRYLAWRLN